MDQALNESKKGFESWAIVEVMGHQRLAGFVTEATIAGTALLRVDVPELSYQEKDWNAPIFNATRQATIPAFTTYLGAGSIYRLTPCDEATARLAVQQFRERPINCVRLPELPALPAPPEALAEDAEIDEEDQEDDDSLSCKP